MSDIMEKVLCGLALAMVLMLTTCSNKKPNSGAAIEGESSTINISADSTFLTFNDGCKALIEYKRGYHRFKIFEDNSQETCEFQWGMGRTPNAGMRVVPTYIVNTSDSRLVSPFYSFGESGRVNIMVDSIRPISSFKDYNEYYAFYYEGLMTVYHDNGFVSERGWVLFGEDDDPITSEYIGKWDSYGAEGKHIATAYQIPIYVPCKHYREDCDASSSNRTTLEDYLDVRNALSDALYPICDSLKHTLKGAYFYFDINLNKQVQIKDVKLVPVTANSASAADSAFCNSVKSIKLELPSVAKPELLDSTYRFTICTKYNLGDNGKLVPAAL